MFQNQLEKQLTLIILVRILVHLCVFLPYSISKLYTLVTDKVYFQLTEDLTEHVILISYASSFYVNISVSDYVRQHLKCIFLYKNYRSLQSMKESTIIEQTTFNI